MTDYWLNRIGSAATATTPTGSVPEYGLAFDMGTAAWPDSQTFNTAVSDAVLRRRAQDIQAMEQAKADAETGWFQDLLGGTMETFQEGLGFIAGGPFQELDEKAMRKRGGKVAKAAWEAPVFAGFSLEDYDKVWQGMTRPVETVLLMDRNTAMQRDMGLWFDPSAYGQAWREAEERTLGEAFADALFTGNGATQADVEAMRRTNSAYGMTSFAAELVAGFKFDPAVLAAKGIGEAKRISLGALPRGQTSKTAAREARRVLQAEDPLAYRYHGINPAGHYGTWRGRKIYDRFDALRAAAIDRDFIDFSNLSMFRVRGVNGAQAALAFKIAAEDDKLWDLTRRLIMADPYAWRQLDEMRTNPEQFPEYFRENTDAGTFIDAIDATKTRARILEQEIADLEKTIRLREERGPQPLRADRPQGGVNPGFFEYHTWELHRDLESKARDLQAADDALAKYDDYAEWLRAVEGDNGPIHTDQVSAKQPKMDTLSSRTYQKSPFGIAHRVSKIGRTAYLNKANSIDLHRPDLGVMSIRRQFQQFDTLFEYKNRDALEDILLRYTKARTTQERWDIAQEVEDVHLIGALSQKYGLSPEVFDVFLRETRIRRNEMAEALRAGKGAVYSTAPLDDPLRAGDSVKVLDVKNGQVKLEVMDKGEKHTMFVPEESLQGYSRPVDPTQTPQYYQPMDTRQVDLAVKHNAELFELLDSDLQHFGRKVTAATIETIDKWGTRWNALWKPLQLFRLAWPQRVLMDEWFRSLAILGVSEWSRAYIPALRVASLNAINPTLHNFGLVDRWKRRHIKIGPGPLADRTSGRQMDTLAHEEAMQAVPFVPAHLAPRFNGRRAQVIHDFLREAVPAGARRARAAALLRNPNPTQSLDPEVGLPANWQDIDSALAVGSSHTLFNGVDVEDFDTSDFAFAAAGYRMTDEDVVAELSRTATSDVNKIDRFLMAPPGLQAAIWNGDEVLLGDWGTALHAINDIVDEFRPGGAMRDKVREAVKRGKEEFQKDVAKRRTGAGHQPLFSGVFDDFDTPFSRLELLRAKELGAKFVPVSSRILYTSAGLGPLERRLAVNLQDLTVAPRSPIYDHIAGVRANALASTARVTQVFDPSNGRTTRQGFAVRVASMDLPEGPARVRQIQPNAATLDAPEQLDAIDRFIVQNHEFLSASGYRLMTEATGDGATRVSVVRYFRSNERERAVEFARHVQAPSIKRLSGLNRQTKPQAKNQEDVVGPTRVGNPVRDESDGYELYIQDDNYGPIFEDLDRIIREVHEQENDILSTTPAPLDELNRPVFHGTQRELPEQLRPRREAGVDNGRMLGPGFYTATDKDTAAAYGRNLYTIKGTRDGRTYQAKPFNDRISDEERADLLAGLDEFIARNQSRGETDFGPEEWAQRTREWRERLSVAVDWEDALGGLTDWRGRGGPDLQADEWLVDHMLSKGFGAWEVSWGDTGIYVWFDTENLVIKPAYSSIDRFYKLDEWFAHPESRERLVNQVPESRIIRRRRRDPEFGDLERLHRDVETRAQELERQGKTTFSDPVYHAMKGREEKLMQRLGLRYSHELPRGQRDETHWWTQVNPQAPAASRFLDSLGRETGDINMGAMTGLEFDPVESFKHELRLRGQRGEEFLRKLLRRREFGKGYATARSADGKDISYHQVFEAEGDVYVPLVSAAPTYARLSDTYHRTLSRTRQRAVGYKRHLPPDVSPEALATRPGRKKALEYYTEWADLLNTQIRNSKIWFRMLDGQTDEQILDWLMRTDEGARLRQSLPEKGSRPEKWVEEHRQRLEFYLPDEELRGILRDRKITPDELWRIDGSQLPEIYTPDLQMVDGSSGAGRMWATTVDRIYHALGTIPTDMLSRQPYAKALYDLKMRNLIATAEGDMLTPKMMARFEKLSREFAIRQIRRVLYDLTDETNFTQMLRFVSPFWGAQQDAMAKWMNIIAERPETAARFFVGVDTIYEHFTVVDEDGVTIKPSGNAYNPNDRVILHIPNRLKKLPFFKEALENFGTVGISFGAANVALQGDMPLMPSLGPLVTVNADWLAARMWDTHGAQFDNTTFYRWLFPVGRSKSDSYAGMWLESVLPGWGRRMQALQEGQDSRTYMNTWAIVQREMHLEARRKGLPPPSAEEVEKAVRWHFGLRVLASFTLPAAMEFRPKHQFYLDEYHKFQREYGPGQAFELFYKKYGADATRFAASSSSSGLVPSTGQGMTEWSGIRDIVQHAVETENADLASAFISPDAWADDFSSDSYNEQFKIAVGPGMDRKLREIKDPHERQAETDRRLGWVEFRQFMSALNSELYNNGLTSLEQRGAEELAALKREWVAMRTDPNSPAYNAAWARDYREFADTIYQKVHFLSEHAFDPRFDGRPDILGLRQYLLIRQATAQSLDQWAAQGGSRSLQAEENTDLRNWFYSQVGQLIQANPAFGEFYIRFLDSDRLERGSGP